MKRVPFSERLWRPEKYVGPHSEADRDALRLAIATKREDDSPEPDYSAQEFRPGYMRSLQRKIQGEQAEPQMRPVVRMDRAVGDRR